MGKRRKKGTKPTARGRFSVTVGNDAGQFREYTPDEMEFMRAIEDYKARTGDRFPTFRTVHAIAIALGYRKVADEEGPKRDTV